MKPETLKKETYQINSLLTLEAYYNNEELSYFYLKDKDGNVISISKHVSLALVQAIKNSWEVK